MSEIRFLCPQCQQHIRCDAAHAGRRTSCPTCGATIKIPPVGAGQGGLLRAEPVQAPGKTQPIQGRKAEPKSAGRPLEETKAGSGMKKPAALGESRAAEAVSGRAPSPKLVAKLPKPEKVAQPLAIPMVTVKCVCPSCRAQLEMKIPAGAVPGEVTASAEVVASGTGTSVRGEAAVGGAGSAAVSVGVAGGQVGETGAAVERAQPARPGGTMKPRMSYVLTGKPPVPVPAVGNAGLATSRRGNRKRPTAPGAGPK